MKSPDRPVFERVATGALVLLLTIYAAVDYKNSREEASITDSNFDTAMLEAQRPASLIGPEGVIISRTMIRTPFRPSRSREWVELAKKIFVPGKLGPHQTAGGLPDQSSKH